MTSALHVLIGNIGSLVFHLRLARTGASSAIGPACISLEVVAPNLPDEVERKRPEDEKTQRDANVAPPLENLIGERD